MSRSDLIDLTMRKHAETKHAVLVSDDGVEKNAVWLPLSQIEVAPVLGTTGATAASGTILITLPEWLAIDKGLV